MGPITGRPLTNYDQAGEGAAGVGARTGDGDDRLIGRPVGQVVGKLISVNVGRPTDIEWQGRTIYTGLNKHPVPGLVMARRLNLDGDGQGDTGGHGGEQRAVLVYQAESYQHWREFFGRADLEAGVLGENFTVTGLPDDEVCIGDRYAIGDAEFEVTQPRVTCYRAGIRIGVPEMASLLVSHHRPGFYLRVIREGHVRQGDAITLVAAGPHSMTVAEIDALLYLPDADPKRVSLAASLSALSPGWQGSFQGMSHTPLDDPTVPGSATGTEPGWAGFMPLTVVDLTRETAHIVSVHLAHPHRAALPRPSPGQHLTIRLSDAANSPVRNYSISAASETSYRISVKQEPHGVASRWIHNELHIGATLDATTPSGAFTLGQPDGRPVMLISAGIGVTPMLAMLRSLAETDPATPVWWLHATRSSSQHVFAREADDLLARIDDVQRHIWYSREQAPTPGIRAGRITEKAIAALQVPTSATAFVCGPTGFIDDTRQALVTIGIDPTRIHSELFGAAAPINPGVIQRASRRPHQPPGTPGGDPGVTFARSGLTVGWSSRFKSLLELAEACDVPTRWACRTGVCHTCATRVLAGQATYDTDPLAKPQAGEVLVCTASPKTDIVLDM